MTKRERIKCILAGQETDRAGFWMGNPTDETKLIYCEQLGIVPQNPEHGAMCSDGHASLLATIDNKTCVDLADKLDSDFFWCSPELQPDFWRHPGGKPVWDVLGGRQRVSLTQAGVFADCQSVAEVDAFDWPDPKYLDFSSTLELIDYVNTRDMAVLGGMWMPFFHIVGDFFGMDNYFMKMYTHPHVVEAVTDRVVSFYLEANKRCLDLMADRLDGCFFGNDLGSQLDLLVSPECFRRFILPGLENVVNQIKSYNLKVVMHSCGAISKIIPALIDIGIDGLHPLQAKAQGMDAESLKRFRGKIAFIGGVDTQELLPFKGPAEVAENVRKLKDILGKRFVVSPSHEALLPNVSLENVMAMRDAAIH